MAILAVDVLARCRRPMLSTRPHSRNPQAPPTMTCTAVYLRVVPGAIHDPEVEIGTLGG